MLYFYNVNRYRKEVGNKNNSQKQSNLHNLEENIYTTKTGDPTSEPDIVKGDLCEEDKKQCCVQNEREEKDTQI